MAVLRAWPRHTTMHARGCSPHPSPPPQARPSASSPTKPQPPCPTAPQLAFLIAPVSSDWKPYTTRTFYFYSEFAATGVADNEMSCVFARWYNPGVVCKGFTNLNSSTSKLVRARLGPGFGFGLLGRVACGGRKARRALGGKDGWCRRRLRPPARGAAVLAVCTCGCAGDLHMRAWPHAVAPVRHGVPTCSSQAAPKPGGELLRRPNHPDAPPLFDRCLLHSTMQLPTRSMRRAESISTSACKWGPD